MNIKKQKQKKNVELYWLKIIIDMLNIVFSLLQVLPENEINTYANTIRANDDLTDSLYELFAGELVQEVSGFYILSLKTESCHDANFGIPGGTAGWCWQWRQSWHHGSSWFSVIQIEYVPIKLCWPFVKSLIVSPT